MTRSLVAAFDKHSACDVPIASISGNHPPTLPTDMFGAERHLWRGKTCTGRGRGRERGSRSVSGCACFPSEGTWLVHRVPPGINTHTHTHTQAASGYTPTSKKSSNIPEAFVL